MATKSARNRICVAANAGSACVGARSRHGRDLEEQLHDQHEHVQVQRRHRSDHIHPPPRTLQVLHVQREDDERQDHQRERADDVRGQEGGERESKSRGVGRDCGDEEDLCPSAEAPVGHQAAHDEDAGDDADDAEDDVDEGECRHGAA